MRVFTLLISIKILLLCYIGHHHKVLCSPICQQHIQYIDDFWRKGNDATNFGNFDMEAFKKFHHLELELLKSYNEKIQKSLREFCKNYNNAQIPLDVDRLDSLFDIYGEELKKYDEGGWILT